MSSCKSFIPNDTGNEIGLYPFIKGNTPPVMPFRQHVTGSITGPYCFARRAAARAGERKQGITLPAACSKDEGYLAAYLRKVLVL